jgi:predicted O-methyltransferase YrrM
MVLSDETVQYLEKLIPPRDEHIQAMERYAQEHKIPIMEFIGIETLIKIIQLYQPKKMLEIGTAIGYSAIRMVEATSNSQVITIEKDQHRFDTAIQNIEMRKLQDQITVLLGDALELKAEIQRMGPFELIFIDAAKGQYRHFFDLYAPMLEPGGVIISDNVLFKGLVAKDDKDISTKRFQKLAEKIRTYNQFLMTHSEYDTAILPIGDGIAVSIKK